MKQKKKVIGSFLLTLAAYFFIAVFWILTIELEHSYQHWLGEIDPGHLPRLTLYSLAFLGLENHSWFIEGITTVIWITFLLWPGTALVWFFRRSEAGLDLLGLNILIWLLFLLGCILFFAIGLWLPFSYL